MPTGTRPRPGVGMIKMVNSGNSGGTEWANILWLATDTSATPTEDDLTALVDAWITDWEENIFTHLSTAFHFTNCQAVMFLSDSSELVSDNAVDFAGTDETGVLPANAAMVLSWGISAYYRGGKPRTYLPGIPLSFQESPNSFTSGSLTEIAGGAASLLSEINSYTTSPFDGVQLGVLSFSTGGAYRADALFRPYTGVGVHPRIDSQRRRLGRETV